MYISCACNLTVDHLENPIQFYNVNVRPTDPETSFIDFKICLNIKLLPWILTVQEQTKGESFVISWKNEQTEQYGFKYHHELCYWIDNHIQPNEVAFDCPGDSKILSPNDDLNVLLKLGKQLTPSTNYSVKVRVKLGEKDPDHCYKGPWSEWSNVQTFHTKSVPNTLLLCILVLSAVVVFVICAVCGCRALVRYKKQWDDRIPNPSKSSIIKGLRKAKNGASLPSEEHFYVEPYNTVLMWAPSKKEINLQRQDEEQVTQPLSELLQDDDTQCLFLFDMTKDEYPTASITDEYKPFSELIDEQENRDMEDSQFTVCAFDGPYLFS
ncbi:cytokine receptor common subunit beta-like [Rhinoderma darwinii]|uniref:cytokine receptor common subunit beta-like n=1 Tax=Rhinoderma darwinii TaxID=43563 RepID=UPI003F664A4C